MAITATLTPALDPMLNKYRADYVDGSEVVYGSLSGLRLTAPDGVGDGQLLIIESTTHTFEEPESFNYLGFGGGWLYKAPANTHFKDTSVSTTKGVKLWDYEGTIAGDNQRYVYELGGIKYLKTMIWATTGTLESAGGCINWDCGRATVAGDRLIQYSRGRCTIQGAGIAGTTGGNTSGGFQMKDERMGAYPNLEVNVNHSAYLKSYGNGNPAGETVDVLGANGASGELYYNGGINKNGNHYTQLWRWKINTPDVADGGHIIASKSDGYLGGQVVKTSVLNPAHITSTNTETPRFCKWQQYCGNRGNNGAQTLQTDVEWINTDLFAQLNGSIFVIANNAVFTSSTEFTLVVPLQFDSTGRWWVRQWKGKLADYSNAYIHLLDENLNSVVSQKLGA